MAFITFKLIDMTIGLRVDPESELEGLDVHEHGASAYPDFWSRRAGTMAPQGVLPPHPEHPRMRAPGGGAPASDPFKE